MSFKKFLTSRVFFVNLIFAILLIVVLVFIIMQSLNKYTRHGQSNPVPDFVGMTPQEAKVIAEQNNLKVEIIDSVFTHEVPPGAVIEQVPDAGIGVKENRMVFLTINSINKERVALPKLVDISFRQAQVLVESCGLIVGKISYQPSEYNNLVLKIKHDSIEVFQGDFIEKGSIVDFVVGRDSHNQQTLLPNLIGIKPEEATEILTSSMLNFGVLIYDESILTAEDSLNAIVWKQRPGFIENTLVKLGSTVDLWITVDEEKINKVIVPEL